MKAILDLLEAPDLGNSYENWHVRGVDYLCLLRTPSLTIKLYSFGACAVSESLGTIVWPHNHRYGFTNITLAGRITQILYRRSYDPALLPLWQHSRCYPMRQEPLTPSTAELRTIGCTDDAIWSMRHGEVHAIHTEPESLALQLQGADELGENDPTELFVPAGESLGCGGADFYRPMRPSVAREIIKRARLAIGGGR